MKLIEKPTQVEAHGNIPKIIQEFIGRVNSGTEDVSIAGMNSPEGWIEEGQTPEFEEYTLVLKGVVRVETKAKIYEIKAGQVFVANKGEWVQYSLPYSGGAEYISVCIPAFHPELAHRDEV